MVKEYLPENCKDQVFMINLIASLDYTVVERLDAEVRVSPQPKMENAG